MKAMALSVLCLLLLVVVGAAAGKVNRVAVENGEGAAADYRPCTIDFENLDFTPLTSSCNPSGMTAESCCRQFDFIFQQHLDEMVDNVACAEEVFSNLDARGYKALDFDTLCLEGGRREAQQVNSTRGGTMMPAAPSSSPNGAFAMVVPTCFQLAISMGAFFALL